VPFRLELAPRAAQELHDLEHHKDRKDLAKLKRVRNCLGLLERNPKHPSLKTHEYSSITGANGEKVWEAYVENNTPAAWRVFWHYGPPKTVITVVAITPHP
jgi:hypothetical protein